MVSSNLPMPSRNNTSESPKACCKVCNSPVSNHFPREEFLWCASCNQYQPVYRGPVRRSLCETCFNCVGTDARGRYLCAALMYEMPDGTWRDRYNNSHRSEYRQNGMTKVKHPILPDPRPATYVCECFEELKNGETRESIKISDPVRFYDKRRFW